MFSVSNRLAPSALDTNHNKNVEVFFFFFIFPKVIILDTFKMKVSKQVLVDLQRL